METMSSNNDPLFYLHHANIDRYLDLWRKQHPNSPYNGAHRNRSPVSVRDVLQPLNATAGEAMNQLPNVKYCYEYSSGVAPVTGSMNKRQMSNTNNCSATALEYPAPIPQDWLKMMGGDLTANDDYEREAKNTIDLLNAACYVSDSCIVAKRKNVRMTKLNGLRGLDKKTRKGAKMRSILHLL